MAMTPAQARAINPLLTEVARGYTNQEFVGLKLFPYVPVAQRGGQIVKFGKEQFRLLNTERAPGANVASTDFEYSTEGYALKQHALAGKVPIELMEDASQVPGVDLGKVAVNQVMEQIGLKLEYKQATLARTAGSYASENKATLSGTSQWSHTSSTPTKDIKTAREAIRSKIGRYPNILILGAPVFAALTEHAAIVDRIKYTGRDSITPQMLAQLLNVDEVQIGGSVYMNAAGAFVDVWGKDAILAYSAPVSLAQMGSPSFAYTYRLKNHPVVNQPYFNEANMSWYYRVVDEHDPVMTGADAGYLFTNAVA